MRQAAGLTGEELAAALGWVRSKISKIENGRQVPSREDITAWAGACGHPEVIPELLDMLTEVRTVHTRWRRRLRDGGQSSVQQDIDTLTRAAARIRNAEVTVIPGLLQTAGHARAIAGQVSVVNWIAAFALLTALSPAAIAPGTPAPTDTPRP